ncbi:MFS transporter [Cryptosporangium aurantiacum]|uniref:MFS transporter, SET family, sugar efflux transporter n=1 Tax=Cryptosporangium aurantiacum TaxID=134849 RepID=A0A1M7TXU5_9ACTN|nr:MFS transporter [Cryptosporangium aurantiacum]SHN75528.1 MFS transporter, SET family, sugar efflux transporter [Cryptosporangium aurantiacum]
MSAPFITSQPHRPKSVGRWYAVSLVFLAVGLSMAMTFPFRALFLTDAVHAGPVLVTVFLLVAAVTGVLAASALGRLSDSRPWRSRLIVAASLAGVVGCGLSAVVRNYWVLLIVTATAVAVSTALQAQLFAYARVAVGTGERAALTINALRTLFSASWVAGPFLAAVLIEVGGFTLIFAVAAGVYAVAAVVAQLGMPEPAPTDAAVPDAALPEDGSSSRDVSEGLLWLNVVGLVLMQTAAVLGVQALPLFVDEDLHGSVRDTGLILGLCAALEIPLMLAFGALAGRIPIRVLYLVGPALAAAYFAVVAVSTGTGQVAAAQILNASGIALIQGIGITYFLDLLPNRPGRASTLFSNAFPIGATLSAPLLGVAQHIGYRYGFAAAAVLSTVGLALVLTRRTPSRR